MITNCCKKCDCNPCKCGDPCGCPAPVISVEQMTPDNLALLRYNSGGHSTHYDHLPMIKWGETDTAVSISATKRGLNYSAEKHNDFITANQLGGILHLTDLGDVDETDLDDHSMLVYRKNSDCGSGCVGLDNTWVAWNALDNLEDSLQYIMGFDADGVQQALNAPTATNQYYTLGWNGAGKVGWAQPVDVTEPSTDSDGYARLSFIDPATHQMTTLKVKVEIGDDGTITLKAEV